jgi:Flp pilus assembly protein TadD
MTLGIAHSDLGDEPSARAAFAKALALVGLEPPVAPDRDLLDKPQGANEAARDLFRRALALPEDSAARRLFLAVAHGEKS